MKKESIIVIVVLLLIIAIFMIVGSRKSAEQAANATPTPTSGTITTTTDTVVLANPASNATITSPLMVSGTAPSSWFFEGSFPITLKDSKGLEVARATAQALGDWTTGGPVQFRATVTFRAPAAINGTLILKNDNPTGDPSRDKSFSIPVIFSQGTTSSTTVKTTTTTTVNIVPTGK